MLTAGEAGRLACRDPHLEADSARSTISCIQKRSKVACFSCRLHFRHLDDLVDQLVGKGYEQLGFVATLRHWFYNQINNKGGANDVGSKSRRRG